MLGIAKRVKDVLSVEQRVCYGLHPHPWHCQAAVAVRKVGLVLLLQIKVQLLQCEWVCFVILNDNVSR